MKTLILILGLFISLKSTAQRKPLTTGFYTVKTKKEFKSKYVLTFKETGNKEFIFNKDRQINKGDTLYIRSKQ